jgi:VanZ family protein
VSKEMAKFSMSRFKPGNRIIRAVTAIYIFFIIFIVYSAITASNREVMAYAEQVPGADKTCHVVLIGLLCLLLNLSFNTKRRGIGILKLSGISIALLLLVSLEEYSQNFLVNRTADWFDWLGNFAGVIIGDISVAFAKNRSKSHSPLS